MSSCSTWLDLSGTDYIVLSRIVLDQVSVKCLRLLPLETYHFCIDACIALVRLIILLLSSQFSNNSRSIGFTLVRLLKTIQHAAYLLIYFPNPHRSKLRVADIYVNPWTCQDLIYIVNCMKDSVISKVYYLISH